MFATHPLVSDGERRPVGNYFEEFRVERCFKHHWERTVGAGGETQVNQSLLGALVTVKCSVPSKDKGECRPDGGKNTWWMVGRDRQGERVNGSFRTNQIPMAAYHGRGLETK
jgi:hypothetical protein